VLQEFGSDLLVGMAILASISQKESPVSARVAFMLSGGAPPEAYIPVTFLSAYQASPQR
jgi:hypothetical protein